MVARTDGKVYVFDLKVREQAGHGAAMAQIKERGYSDKYRAVGASVHLVAIEFSSESRQVEHFYVQSA